MPRLKFATVTIDLPVRPQQPGYVPSTIDGSLSPAAGRGLKGLHEGLVACGARLQDGSKINEYRHALCWLLERIEVQAECVELPPDEESHEGEEKPDENGEQSGGEPKPAEEIAPAEKPRRGRR